METYANMNKQLPKKGFYSYTCTKCNENFYAGIPTNHKCFKDLGDDPILPIKPSQQECRCCCHGTGLDSKKLRKDWFVTKCSHCLPTPDKGGEQPAYFGGAFVRQGKPKGGEECDFCGEKEKHHEDCLMASKESKQSWEKELEKEWTKITASDWRKNYTAQKLKEFTKQFISDLLQSQLSTIEGKCCTKCRRKI